MEDLVLSCLESRVEQNRNLYARFLLGPFPKGNALTVGTALRRTLLSSIESIGIISLYIQGITHEFSTIAGVRESVLELSLNFQQVVLFQDESRALSKQVQVGYLQVQGPRVVYANDLKLPLGVELVNPTQYIATVSTKGLLVVKFLIGYSSQRRVKHSNLKNNFALAALNEQNILNVKNSVSRALKKPSFFVQNKTLLTPFHRQNIFLQKQEQQALRVSNISSQLYKQQTCVKYCKFCFNKSRVSKQRPCFSSRLQTGLLLSPFYLSNRLISGKTIPVFLKDKSCGARRFVCKPALTAVNQFSPSQTKAGVILLSNTTLRKEKRATCLSFKSEACLRNVIPLDTMLTAVNKVNFVVETDGLYNTIKERLVFEVWTNGSIHPRQAIHEAALSLLDMISPFRNLFQSNVYLAPTVDVGSANKNRTSLRLNKKITKAKLLLSAPVLCLCLTKPSFVNSAQAFECFLAAQAQTSPQKDVSRGTPNNIQNNTTFNSLPKLPFRLQKQGFYQPKSALTGTILLFSEGKGSAAKTVVQQKQSCLSLKSQQLVGETKYNFKESQKAHTSSLSQMVYNVRLIDLGETKFKLFTAKKIVLKANPATNTAGKKNERHLSSYTYVGNQSFAKKLKTKQAFFKTGFGYRFLPLFAFSLFKESFQEKQKTSFPKMLPRKDTLDCFYLQKSGKHVLDLASSSPLSSCFLAVERTNFSQQNKHVEKKALKYSKLQKQLLASFYKKTLDKLSFLESDVSNLPLTLKTLRFLKQKGVYTLHNLLRFSSIDLLDFLNGNKEMFYELKRFILKNPSLAGVLSTSPGVPFRSTNIRKGTAYVATNGLSVRKHSKRHKPKHLK